MSTKVVYNNCLGGFSFSEAACKRLLELNVEGADMNGSRYVSRHDPRVIRVVEEFQADANGKCAYLVICTIEGNKYRISDDNGLEHVYEPGDLDWIEV